YILSTSSLMDEENKYNGIDDEKPLGLSEQIRAWRTSMNMSVEEVAKQLSVRPQIILALEEGDYGVFPARVYATGYLKRLIDHFSIPKGDVLLDMLKIEWEEKRGRMDSKILAFPHNGQKKFYITPQRFLGVCGCVIFLFFVWFLGMQLIGFTAAPRLHIDEPQTETITDMPIVRVKGTTEKESQLTVNGREITMNGDGAFDEEIELASGVNVLHFFAKNRFGKSSEEIRYVVVR
ncbi:MAG: helix-turn-helix domain-containing protein, partial [Patescibacteria group bacterium]